MKDIPKTRCTIHEPNWKIQ